MDQTRTIRRKITVIRWISIILIGFVFAFALLKNIAIWQKLSISFFALFSMFVTLLNVMYDHFSRDSFILAYHKIIFNMTIITIILYFLSLAIYMVPVLSVISAFLGLCLSATANIIYDI